MRVETERWLRVGAWSVVASGGILLAAAPAWAPMAVLAGLATAAWPVFRAWRGASGTGLRPAVVWAGLAMMLGMASQVLAWCEPLASGRPSAGHACYLAVLAALAGLVSVLNARTPGAGAWAILTSLLVLVFLIPWLEGPGLARGAQGAERLRLDAPWTIFYGLVVVAGVTNYLPTRYGPAAISLVLGFVLEYLALTNASWSLTRKATVWSAVPWTLAVSAWLADARSRRPATGRDRLERAWLWFRDHWGVVWGLRVVERFNRSAEAQGWPVRLGWYGVIEPPGHERSRPEGDAAERLFRSLVRRFADSARVEAVEIAPTTAPCGRSDGP